MSKFFFLSVFFISNLAFAGRVKEVVIMAQESMVETLGIDESYLEFSQMDFVTRPGADLAIQAKVKNIYSENSESFDCVTEFKRNNEFYQVSKTECQ